MQVILKQLGDCDIRRAGPSDLISVMLDFSIKWSFGLKLNIDDTTHNHASDSKTIGRL